MRIGGSCVLLLAHLGSPCLPANTNIIDTKLHHNKHHQI